MKVFLKFFSMLLLVIIIPGNVYCQFLMTSESGWEYRWGENSQNYFSFFDGSTSTMDFNFFTGPDVEDYRVTLKGFGSIGNSVDFSLVAVGNDYLEAFLGAGISVRYYRFEELPDSWAFFTPAQAMLDNGDFENKFFSWSKSKTVIGYFTVPLGFELKSRIANIRIQASYTRYLSGKYKLKYKDPDNVIDHRGNIALDFIVPDENEKYKVPNSDFNDLPLNKDNFTLLVMLAPKISGMQIFNIGFKYDLKPLFEEGMGPDIHESAIVLHFGMN